MDINQFIRVAESNGLEAINLIKNSKATQTATPTRTVTGSLDIRPLYTSMAQPQPAAPIVTPKIDLYPKQLYPTQLYTPMKAGVSIQISEPTLKQIGIAYPAKLTSDTKPFELPDITKFPKLSEMAFGEPAAMFNRWANKIPQLSIDIENNFLEKSKTDLQNKLQNEIDNNQGDSIQAKKLRTDLTMIDDALKSDSYFVKRAVTFPLGQQYVFGTAGAGVVETGKNLWSFGKSVYDQFALSDEEKKKVQEQNTLVEDPVTKFFDNVLKDLRVSEQGPFAKTNSKYLFQLTESIGGMAGLMYASSFAKSPWAATLIGSTVESLTEGGATYQENRKNGMSVEEAMNRQLGVIGLNLVFNYAFNRLTGVFEGLSEKKVKSLFKKGVGLLGVGTGEGSQEAVQQIISYLATNRPIDEGVLESFGFGFIIGGGVQSIKLIHGPTGKVLLEQPIIPQVGRQITENELALINGVAGTNVNINSSMDEITRAYYQAVSIAANMENASGLYARLDGAYQLINSYKTALGQVSYKSDIDPKGELNNREFAIKATEKNLNLKEEARGIEKNPVKRYLNELKNNYSYWVNNVETQGRFFQDLDRQAEKRLGRKLKPGESVDIPYDELFQLSNIVEKSPEYQELTSISNDLIKNRLSADEFGQYLISKRNIGLYEAGAKIDVNVQDELRVVSGFAPLYEKYAQRYYKVMNNIAKMIWDAGLITTEEYVNITKNNDYAPFYTIFSENNQPVAPELQKTKKVGLGRQTVTRKFESKLSQQVENPFLISPVYLTHAYKQMLRNEVGLALINTIENGDYQKAGFKGYIVQTAEDGRARQLVRDLKPQIEKIVNKVTNTLRKQKKTARLLQKEVNDMVRKGFKIISMSDTAQVDTVTQNRLARKVETQLNKREELMQDAEDIFQGILEVKQTGEQVLNDKKYLDKTNRMLETRNEWVQDLVDLGADMLGKKGKKFMAESNLKFPTKKQRKNFIKSASINDIYDFLYEFYDMPQADFNKLLNKAEKNNLKITQVLQDIRNIKDAQVVNIVVNNLIKLPSAEVDALYQKYGKTQKAIGKVITELKRLTDARITNAAVNSLIKNTPEELTKIKK